MEVLICFVDFVGLGVLDGLDGVVHFCDVGGVVCFGNFERFECFHCFQQFFLILGVLMLLCLF